MVPYRQTPSTKPLSIVKAQRSARIAKHVYDAEHHAARRGPPCRATGMRMSIRSKPPRSCSVTLVRLPAGRVRREPEVSPDPHSTSPRRSGIDPRPARTPDRDLCRPTPCVHVRACVGPGPWPTGRVAFLVIVMSPHDRLAGLAARTPRRNTIYIRHVLLISVATGIGFAGLRRAE